MFEGESRSLPEAVAEYIELMNSEDIMECMRGVCQLSMNLAIAPDDSFSNLPLSPLLEALVECL